ncbi:MAG: deoxyribonuclease IV [Oscillospiraceae bacterium]|jgi:deoxyribonuclease-4|nr:deoxyribonuclease IV [Oscillospiraceae bacterium]
MTYLGAHLSSSGGFYKMGKAALAIGANTLQCFVRNPRGAKAKAINPTDLGKLRELMAENSFGPIVAHAPYIMNPCSKDEGIRALAAEMMAGDLELLEHLPGNYYNFHPGSHTGQGVETGCRQIADMLTAVVKPEQKTVVLLETMAGKGSEIGGRFEELRAILDLARCPQDRLGVCLDTCHVSDAGYDITNDLDGVLAEFDRVIGLSRLLAIHVNDSMNPLGARKDRHALIGQGAIGTEAIVRVLTHPALRRLPFVLETPTDDAGHGEEIAMLRERLGEAKSA